MITLFFLLGSCLVLLISEKRTEGFLIGCRAEVAHSDMIEHISTAVNQAENLEYILKSVWSQGSSFSTGVMCALETVVLGL